MPNVPVDGAAAARGERCGNRGTRTRAMIALL